jgi:hypothetical protein
MPITAKWKQLGVLITVLVVGYMPVFYETLAWWPHNRWARILCGPVAMVLDAALVGAAANRFSKWWLLALIVPMIGIIVLLTASV